MGGLGHGPPGPLNQAPATRQNAKGQNRLGLGTIVRASVVVVNVV